MAEIVEFVNRGVGIGHSCIVEKLLRHLPQWKLEFTQILRPCFRHLVINWKFWRRGGRRCEGAYKDLPYAAFAQAAFA